MFIATKKFPKTIFLFAYFFWARGCCEAQMELPATKRAYELTLSETLEIPSEDLRILG